VSQQANVISHCRPNGGNGPYQCSVPRVGPDLFLINDSTLTSGGKIVRHGRIMFLPGIGGSTLAGPFWNAADASIPGFLPAGDTLIPDLNALGWQTVQCPNVPQSPSKSDSVSPNLNVPGMTYSNKNILSDINGDPGHGLQYAETSVHYFDHCAQYAIDNDPSFIGAMPMLAVGMSWGAYWTCNLARKQKPGTRTYPLLAAYAHCPVNDFAHLVDSVYGLQGWADQGSAFFSGISLSTSALNGVLIPTRVTWGYDDGLVTGGNGTSSPPVDAIAMMANACRATGGTVWASTATIASASNAVDLNGSAFVSGTGSLTFVDPTSSFAGFPTSGHGAIVPGGGTPGYSTNGYGIVWTGFNPSTGVMTGIRCDGATGGTGKPVATGNPLVSSVGTGGLVTGTGFAENHQWDNATLAWNYDSVDLKAWLASSPIAALFPLV
jgi:hypothetical protein